MRIPAACIRQHEHVALAQALLLKSYRHRALLLRKHGAIDRDPDKRDHLRLVAANLRSQTRAARRGFFGLQLVNYKARTRDDISDAESPFRQPIVVEVRHRFGNEAGEKQELPEPIREAREVMASERGSDARVDADEHHLHARANSVSQRWQCLRCAARSMQSDSLSISC